MNPDLFSWLERIGLILGFFSFWFAAPEILGEERLKKIELSLEKTIGCISFVFSLLIVLSVILIGILSVGLLEPVFVWFQKTLDCLGSLIFAGIALGVGVILVELKRSLQKLLKKYIKQALSRLADDSKIRQRALQLGALLFVVGSLFQFLGTF